MASLAKKSEIPEPAEHSPSPTPKRAIYGFVLYLLSYVGFGFFLFWALLPDEWLHSIGITYLPLRIWIFLGPFLFVVSIAVVLLLYMLYNYLKTPDLDSLDYLTDCHQKIGPPVLEGLSPLADMSISDVNRLLYHKKKI